MCLRVNVCSIRRFHLQSLGWGGRGGRGEGLPVRLCVVDVPVQVESNEAGKCFVVVVVMGFFFLLRGDST